jgi:hypothetical protein
MKKWHLSGRYLSTRDGNSTSIGLTKSNKDVEIVMIVARFVG